jgi:hypothetical protein
MSENLIREYIKDQKIPLSEEAIEGVKKWKNSENTAIHRQGLSMRQ